MIDLSCWNLTIPVNADVISTKTLMAGYQSPFFQRQANGALTFISPSTGPNIKPTKNSKYPRSEFRETRPDGTLVWWIPGEGYHTLFADLQVDSLAEDLKGIFGQFHGKGTNVPLKVQLTGTTLYVQLRPIYTPDDIEDGDPRYPEDKLPVLKGYKLGTRITYKVELNPRGQLNVWVNGSLAIDNYQFNMASYRAAYKGEGDRWYAKAGVYSQTKVGKKGEGRATFYALTIAHTASAELPAPVTPAQLAAPTIPASPEAPATSPKPAEPTLAEQITATYDSWKAGKTTAFDALVAMNAFSKQVGTLKTSKERAPYYDQINDLKARISGAKK